MFTVLFNPFTAKAWITGNYVVSSSVLPMSSEAAWTTKTLWTTPVSLCSTLCDHCWLSSDKRAWNPCLSSAGFLFLDRDFIDLDLVSGSGSGSGSGSCIWFHEEQQNWSMGTLNSCATGACFFDFSLFFFLQSLLLTPVEATEFPIQRRFGLLLAKVTTLYGEKCWGQRRARQV